jgi:hypothetical protein
LVDLIHAFWVPLPQGIPQFFLSAAFGSSGFLMLAHTKGEPLDGLLHQLLGYCMVAVAVVVLVQGASLRGGQSYGLNAAKSLAVIMEVSEWEAVCLIGAGKGGQLCMTARAKPC